MTDGETRALVDDLYRAYREGNSEHVAAIVDDDIDWRREGNSEHVAAIVDDDIDWLIHGPVEIFPFGGARRGKAAVLKVLAEIAALYRLERYQPEIVVVENDRAAVLSDVAFEQRSTGRMLSVRLVNFLRFRDGRLIEFREFANTFDLVEQALGQHIELPAGVLR